MTPISTLKQLMHERRLGFAVDEVMTGEHRFEPGFGSSEPRFMEFRVTWGPRHVSHWLNPMSEQFLTQSLHGTMTVDGLCHDAPCQGTLELLYFSQRAIRYTIEFAAQGRRYRYVGEKRDIWPWNLHVSHTTCYGRLYVADTEELVSTSVTHFQLRTLPSMLASLRLA